MQRVSAGVRERVLDFLARYGERGYLVLKAAVEAAAAGEGRRGVRLGDFSTREVVAGLRMRGVEYNPGMLLRILEREYGVIETTYSSRGQHWWRFIDYAAVVEALDEYERGSEPLGGEGGEEGLEDPELELVRIQLAALDLDGLVSRLRRLASRRRLGPREKLLFRRIVFGPLADAVKLLPVLEEYGEELGEEAGKIREALRLARIIALRLKTPVPAGRRAAVEAVALEERGVE